MTALARTFESPTSRAVEENVLAILRRAWHVSGPLSRLREDPRLRKFNGKPPADFGLVRYDKGHAEMCLVEVKGRDRKYLLPETDPRRFSVDIGKAKIEALLDLARRFESIPPYLIFVMLQDRSVWWIDARTVDTTVTRLGGRPPRPGAPHDKEEMVDIPIRRLVPIYGEWADGGVCDDHIRYIRSTYYG